MPDLLNLDKAITKIDNETLPDAARLANDVIANAGSVLNAAINNGAVLLAQLLGGVESERVMAMNGISTVLAPAIEQWKRTNDVLERLAGVLERVNLKP